MFGDSNWYVVSRLTDPTQWTSKEVTGAPLDVPCLVGACSFRGRRRPGYAGSAWGCGICAACVRPPEPPGFPGARRSCRHCRDSSGPCGSQAFQLPALPACCRSKPCCRAPVLPCVGRCQWWSPPVCSACPPPSTCLPLRGHPLPVPAGICAVHSPGPHKLSEIRCSRQHCQDPSGPRLPPLSGPSALTACLACGAGAACSGGPTYIGPAHPSSFSPQKSPSTRPWPW